MKTCKREGCEKSVQGKAKYCSGACRVAQSRASVTPQRPQVLPDVTVEGKCYNRPAVKCSEFGTRPAPLDSTDIPFPLNRGRYTRQDGTVYMFDAGGQVFECVHPFTDKAGKPHLAVYETAEDVRQAVGGAWA